MSQFLKHKYNETKAINPSFSIRSFASRAGISPGAMSEIIKGKRKLTTKAALKITEKLKLNPIEKTHFLSEISDSQPAHVETGIKRVTFLSQNQFRLMTEGYYFALLSLIDTVNFKNDTNWISKRLGITTEKVLMVLNTLQKTGLIEIEGNRIIKTKQIFSSTDDVKDSFVQSTHIDTLKIAKNSLLNDPTNVRDFSYFTFPVDPSLIPLVKLKIRQFQDEINGIFEGKNNTEVYRLAIQFFPQTLVGTNEDENDDERSA